MDKDMDQADIVDDEAINNYFKSVMPKIARVVKASNGLPSGEQYDFYSTYKDFQDVMTVEGSSALDLLGQVLRHNGIRAPGFSGPQARNVDLEDKFESMIDANDQLAESISNALDEVSGIRKAPKNTAELLVSSTPDNKKINTTSSASWNANQDGGKKKTPQSYRLLAARFVQRPQLSFKEKIDNTDTPFYPKLTEKPHSKLPLNDSLKIAQTNTEDGRPVAVPHPYQYELDRIEYTDQQLDPVINPQKPSPLSESGPLTYIDKPGQLECLMDDLLNVSEIAIDLEHHSYRSFQGLTCLMQLSTRTRDYIIDTLSLRSELTKLNKVFADPKIVKVFHGADSDVEWLQRDFSLYIVNMFDTYQASKLLSFSRHSLAYLLRHYCSVEADKQYQLADWRIRPLPQELIDYAREDTHYLLYVYDRMKNDLIEKGNDQRNLLKSSLDNSKLTCCKVYKKSYLSSDSHMAMYLRSRKSFNNRQILALAKLYKWRYKLAQQEDESTGYILPNHIMLQICETLPRETSGVLACCTPIPPLVRQHLHAIHSLVREAREQPLTASQTIRTGATLQAKVTKSLLDSPHDEPMEDIKVKLPTVALEIGQVKAKRISAWGFMTTSLVSRISEKVRKIKEAFVSPLDNYEPVKHIDFSLAYTQSLQQAVKRHAPADSSLNETLNVTADSTLNDSSIEATSLEPPAAKRRLVQSSISDSDNKNGDQLKEGETEEGEIEEDTTSTQPAASTPQAKLSKAERKRLKKQQAKLGQGLPLRLRPASNPEKQMKKPSAEFKAYDYSAADYSEFKPPEVPKQRKPHHKGQRSNNQRSGNSKSQTLKL